MIISNVFFVQVAPNGITIPYFGESANSIVGTSASILPSLHCILQQNARQRVRIK